MISIPSLSRATSMISSQLSRSCCQNSARRSSQLWPYRRFKTPVDLQYRSLLTTIEEPPVDSSVPERPCTVVLAEDKGFYDTSWEPLFQDTLPKNNGISFTSFSLSATCESMDQALQELSQDLQPMPQVVLIARGPWMSWMAQFYLESLAVAGLVLVDPLPLDDRNSINQFDLAYQKRSLQTGLNYRLFRECTEHWDHWMLRLEPGAVPMMVMSSQTKRGFVRAAEHTIRRHAPDIREDSPWDMSNTIPLVKLDPKQQDSKEQAQEAIAHTINWIDEQVA